MSDPLLSLPPDPEASAALAAQGLRLELVDPGDAPAVRSWLEADARGFTDPAPTDESVAEQYEDRRLRRTLAVVDDDAPEPVVGTIGVFPAELTAPGPAPVGAWAITSVSVAATHRRRGIARQLLEAELRTAVRAGLPLAILTVSEATIYSRYGFGPAVRVAALTIRTKRIRWTGPAPAGRVRYVGRDALLADVPGIFDAARRRTPGELDLGGLLLTGLLGRPSEGDRTRERRFVRYDDEAGAPQGYCSYRIEPNLDDFADGTLHVIHLVAATDDAYAALWRFLLEHDLVGRIEARLRSVDEPLRWMVSDQRAIRQTEQDHLWVRVLDVPGALGARGYAATGRLALDVDDPDGYAAGRWLLEVGEDRTGRARQIAAVPDGVPSLALDAPALGSLLLGGVPVDTLTRAGVVREGRPGDAARADVLLRSPRTPVLGEWF
ncbi:GNAT family N-acetyltransferase [Amnibacterium sp. CER49]|uniref:GNAT family N-acetyltransferase n=1 Tax=Amnibacterium sp. CER49 TaxID=3039161 RepID=UPI002448F989|nr:GNAT family N-acetyltransferase [Amnibacterium sp. CER49]MDH2444592.1 GNAT family N-acetyltransferase [Amnibacterium sp. CER49]